MLEYSSFFHAVNSLVGSGKVFPDYFNRVCLHAASLQQLYILRLVLMGELDQYEVSRNLGKMGLIFTNKNTSENLIHYVLKVMFIDKKKAFRFI
jgi:hypothetical protein